MKRMKLLTFAMLFVGAAAALLAADDNANWPRFRGPNGAGVSEDSIPVKWTDADFAWKTELPGAGHSSPTVWGGSVFVTAADEDAGRRLLLCVNASDGAIRWRHAVEFKPYRKHGENSFASTTPAVDEKHVYVQWTTQDEFTVVAVNHDGTEAWRTDLGPYRTGHGGGGSPVVVGDVVAVNVDQDKGQSFIAGLDKGTGKVRWRTPRASTKFSASTPCLFQPKDGAAPQLVFTTHANGFTAVNPTDGTILWELPAAFTDRVVASPVVAGDLVLCGSGEGGRGKGVVAVTPPGAEGQAASTVYTLTDEVPYVPTPIVFRDRLFTWSDGGVVTCHDAATGTKIWSDRVKAGFFGSPVCAKGKLYCVSKRGEVFVVDATADKFNLLARNELGEQSHATPAVAGGSMYVRTLSHLVCVRSQRVAAIGQTGP
jgi:outer membrane protein assembly factor BamB